jgi:hypothetical protein
VSNTDHTILIPNLGSPSSTEDPKIRSSLVTLQAWLNSPQLVDADIASSANIQGTKIAANTITSVAANSIDANAIQSGAVQTDELASVSVSVAKIRPFLAPVYVSALPVQITGATTTFASGVTSIVVTTSGIPQLGQAVTGSGIASDTVITAITGGNPYTLTLNRATTGASSSTYTIGNQEGDEIYFPADPSNGVIWRFRFKSSSSSSYKWEFVGGSPLLVTAADVTLTQGTGPIYNAGTTALSWTTTVGGDFDITMGLLQNATNLSYTAIAGGATITATDADAIYNAVSGSTNAAYLTRTLRKTALPSGLTITMQHKGAASSTTTYSNRSLRFTPVRVG